MTPLERTLNFIQGKAVDKVPFHPLVMQFAARYAGVPYRDYCLDYGRKCDANLRTAEDFGIDWMHVGGHPYTEAQDYGLDVKYPEDSLPLERGHLINGESDFDKVRLLDVENCQHMMGRVEGVETCAERAGNYMTIFGWAEGPMAEYADLRGLSSACTDLIDFEPQVKEMMAIIVENMKKWITLQVQAGAHVIGIGDFYRKRGEFESAAERYRMLLNEYPGLGFDAATLYKLGVCYLEMNRDKEAERIFQSILQNYEGDKFASKAEKLIEAIE